MIKGYCHKTKSRHIICNFILGMIFGLTVFSYSNEVSLVIGFILGSIYMIYEYKCYRELNKINLLSIQFGSIFTVFLYNL